MSVRVVVCVVADDGTLHVQGAPVSMDEGDTLVITVEGDKPKFPPPPPTVEEMGAARRTLVRISTELT